MSDTVRLSANLSPVVIDALKSIAAARGITMTEALRQAISHEKFLVDASRDRHKVLIEDARNGQIRELVFG